MNSADCRFCFSEEARFAMSNNGDVHPLTSGIVYLTNANDRHISKQTGRC
ncbi:MAG: ectoine synthase [Deltaproteobacteria bacterium]|nr:ectoine synthase [Deltaproteobacteria bacterium]